MKMLIFIVFGLLFTACEQIGADTSKYPAPIIKTSTVVGDDRKDVVTEVVSDYFDVTLTEAVDRDKGFMATKRIQDPEPGKTFKAIFFNIVDDRGGNQYFKTSTDFLNFMSEHGYDVSNQIPNKYGADYTFKRKK